MKPDWKDAPEWANWLAMDANGTWHYYEHEPEISINPNIEVWQAKGMYRRVFKRFKNWQSTREKRPKIS
jgi:hypothetical protein